MSDAWKLGARSMRSLWAAALLVGLLCARGLLSHDTAHPVVAEPERPQVTTSVSPEEHSDSAPSQAHALLEGRPLDLNLASRDELRLLPGIGPKLAAKLIETRDRLGGFRSYADLDAVAGIGSKKLALIAPLTIIGDARAAANATPTEERASPATP